MPLIFLIQLAVCCFRSYISLCISYNDGRWYWACQFYQSIISYISLLSCIGIPMYAVREIAKVRNDKEVRERTTVEILLLHTLLTVLGYLAVAIIANTVAEVKVDIPLFLILSLTIFLLQ